MGITRDVYGTFLGNLGYEVEVSAARTIAYNSEEQYNASGRGVYVVLDVTVASGAGGLTLRIQFKDAASGKWINLNATPTAVTATGTYVYHIYPGIGAAAGGVTQATSGVLPRNWRISIAVGDSSSYTYSLGAQLIV